MNVGEPREIADLPVVLLQRLIQRLNAPFPDRNDRKQNLRNITGVGVFVALFLFLIRPFGIRGSTELFLLICLGFGVVTVVFGVLFDALFVYVLRVRTDVPSWTLGKWILQSTGLIVWIALGNYLFMNLLSDWEWNSALAFLHMAGNTLLIGIFPVVFSGFMIQYKAVKAFQQEADALDENLHAPANQTSQSLYLNPAPDRTLDISLSKLRYIEAMQNYVSVHYLDNGHLRKEVVRGTLAETEQTLSGSTVVRCHRSFLVNLEALEHVSGNAQGLRLRLRDVPVEIPVSRTYIPQVKALISR